MDNRGNKRALTIQEAAEYVGVSRGTLDNWLAKGLLPYEELPGNGARAYRFRRIRKSDLDEFLDGCLHDATALQEKPSRAKVVLLPRST